MTRPRFAPCEVGALSCQELLSEVLAFLDDRRTSRIAMSSRSLFGLSVSESIAEVQGLIQKHQRWQGFTSPQLIDDRRHRCSHLHHCHAKLLAQFTCDRLFI